MPDVEEADDDRPVTGIADGEFVLRFFENGLPALDPSVVDRDIAEVAGPVKERGVG
jgi:hypothetical protein